MQVPRDPSLTLGATKREGVRGDRERGDPSLALGATKNRRSGEQNKEARINKTRKL
jgi:hypothetical protein